MLLVLANESRFVMLAYMSFGSVGSIFSNADESVRFYRKGIQIAQKMGDKVEECYRNMETV
jgi:hypothetical protein